MHTSLVWLSIRDKHVFHVTCLLNNYKHVFPLPVLETSRHQLVCLVKDKDLAWNKRHERKQHKGTISLRLEIVYVEVSLVHLKTGRPRIETHSPLWLSRITSLLPKGPYHRHLGLVIASTSVRLYMAFLYVANTPGIALPWQAATWRANNKVLSISELVFVLLDGSTYDGAQECFSFFPVCQMHRSSCLEMSPCLQCRHEPLPSDSHQGQARPCKSLGSSGTKVFTKAQYNSAHQDEHPLSFSSRPSLWFASSRVGAKINACVWRSE